MMHLKSVVSRETGSAGMRQTPGREIRNCHNGQLPKLKIEGGGGVVDSRGGGSWRKFPFRFRGGVVDEVP